MYNYKVLTLSPIILDSRIRYLIHYQGRSYNRGKGGQLPPPHQSVLPPPKLLENQNFPWEMTIFNSASVETL